jgi:hypothetical protein
MATSTIKEIFVKAINNGLKATETIVESKDKAMAYAALASALAQSGLILTNATADTETSTPAVSKDANTKAAAPAKEVKPESKTPGKEALKQGTDKGVKPEETKVEAAAEQKEVELPETWTDEAVEIKAEQIEALGKLREEYGDEIMNQGVEMFSEGVYKTIEDINPRNIDAFLAFVTAMISGDAQ